MEVYRQLVSQYRKATRKRRLHFAATDIHHGRPDAANQ